MSEGEPSPPDPSGDAYYNPVFERITSREQSAVTAALAYSLYKVAKREWLRDFQRSHGRRPTEAEYRQHAATQTDSVLDSYVARADNVLAAYAEAVIEDVKPRIVEEALRGTFWRAVWPSVVASLLFTLVLLALVLIAAVLGFGFPVQFTLPRATP